MSGRPDPVVQAVIDAAVNGTGGTDGWVFAYRGESLELVAASGPASTVALGSSVPADAGTAGFVVGSGQPIALAPHAGAATVTSAMAPVIGRMPTSILAVPCECDAGVVGVLEVIDKAGGGSFTFDDVELATLLAGIAGVALVSGTTARDPVPDPAVLAGELDRLARNAPERYAAVASVLTALIGNG